MNELVNNQEINNVMELLNILNMCNKAKEQLQISMLLEQMQEMEKNYASVLQELTDVKDKLNDIQKEVKNNVVQISDEAGHDIKEKHHNLQNIRKNLNAGAKQVVQKFKDVGVTALNNVCAFLRIEEKMVQLREDARDNEIMMKMAVEKIEKIESELGATILHAKNVGRAIAGKEALTETSEKKNQFFDMLKKPYLIHQAMYAKQYEKLEKAVGKIYSLEIAADKIKIRNLRNRDSVKNKLSDNKKIVESQNAEKNDMQHEKSEKQRDNHER